MNINALTDLYRHMEWADAAVWAAVMASEGGQADAKLREYVGPPEGAALVEIVPANEASRREHGRSDAGFSHLAFTVTDFDAVCADLAAKGVRFEGGMPAAGGLPGERRLAFFLDGEDNILQLVQRLRPLGS